MRHKALLEHVFSSKITHNAMWLMSDKFIRLFGGLFVGAWVARYLGPEQFGLMNFVMAFAALFFSFSMLGIDNLVIRELAKDEGKKDEILGTALRIRNLGSIFSAVISIVIAYLLYCQEDNLFVILLAIMCAGNIVQSLDVISLYYQSQIKSKIVVINKLYAYIFISLAKIIAIIYYADLTMFVLISAFEGIMGVALLYAYFVKHEGIAASKWKLDLHLAKLLVHEGWPLALGNLSIVIFMKSDQIILGSLLGSKEVGIYSVAVLISGILYSVPTYICSSVFPRLVNLYESERERYWQYSEQILTVLMLFSFVSFIGVYVFVDEFVHTLYGSAYEQAIDVAKIHCLTLIMISQGCIRDTMLLIEHKARISVFITIVCGLLNIGLNVLLIPRYGLIGAALIYLLTTSCVAYFSSFILRGYMKEYFRMQTRCLLLIPMWNYLRRS